MTVPTLGWLGAGRMGSVMAGRLLAAGYPVTVWNRTRAKAQALAERGAKVAASLPELAACDIVFVMVSTPRDLEDVVLGAGGLLDAAKPPTVIVDCSTVDASISGWRRPASTR